MNKKKGLLLISSIAVILLLGVGFSVYRNISEPKISIEQTNLDIGEIETTLSEDPASIKRSGTFKDGDAIHKGSGDATIFTTDEGPILSFGDNFSVTQGPDLFVYLSPNAAGQELGEFISLGELKDNNGKQAYNLPTDYEQYKSVVIWCRAFRTTFAAANLE